MIFQNVGKISLRSEVKRYFADIINYMNYNLYFGVTNNVFSILISVDKIGDKIELNTFNKIIFNKQEQYLIQNNISDLINSIETSVDKSLELHGLNFYIKFPVSMDFINWLRSEVIIINETGQDYQNISLPYIDSILEKNIKWIDKLLFDKSEESIVLLRTESYVICKDIIWKENSNDNFYILGIPTKPIKTIRELTSKDLPLLEELKNKCIEIAEYYGISYEKLYMYFHYHPSYYQLHLHVCVTEHPALEARYLRHYHLDLIIEQIKSDSNYWKNATLRFELSTGSKLCNLLKDKKS